MAAATPARAEPALAGSAAAVQVRGATRRFGAVRAVDGVDLDIARGEVFGLIGHNGAGKTTLFRMMLGLVPLGGGEIRLDDTRVGERDFRAVRRRIGYLPENVVFYDNLSGIETLRFFARLKGAPQAACDALLERVGLSIAAHRRTREYSKGMRQRLGFAQALLGNPQLLFLDEPTNGLDPEGIREFHGMLRELRATGVTIVLTSHLLAELQERVDRLAIMSAGRIRAVGSVPELRSQVDLPVRFEVTLEPGAVASVQAALAPLPVAEQRLAGERLLFNCRREAKMQVIAALGALGGKVRDIGVREASLEDVFFGFAD